MSLWPALVVDLGGTHIRLGLVDGPGAEPRAITGRLAAEAGDLDRAIADYLAEVGTRVPACSLAIAGPVVGDEVVPSNLGWRVSRSALQRAFAFERFVVRNDFYALALSLSRLGAADLAPLGGGTAQPLGPRVVIGPGTGLGVAALIADGGRWIAVPSEAGQANFAPGDARETAITAILARSGRVTVERMISGPGILSIAEALAELEGTVSTYTKPEDVAVAGVAGEPRAAAALDVFFGALGSAAGDAALAFCATGGVCLGGGILPKLLEPLRASRFRARFEDKVPLQDLVRAIPTAVIMRPHPGLLGAAVALEEADAGL